jgi:hypothetical protein
VAAQSDSRAASESVGDRSDLSGARQGERAANLFAVGRYLRPIGDLCATTGCTVLLVHHCKRGAHRPCQPATLADIAWAGFAEFSAQWILLSRRSPFDPETGLHEMWASFGGRAGHSRLWTVDVDEGTRSDPQGRKWDVNVREASWGRSQAADRCDQQSTDRRERRMSALLERDRQRVIEALSQCEAGETARALRDRLGLQSSRVRSALEILQKEGSIESVVVTKGAKRLGGYRVVAGNFCCSRS